MHRLAELIVSVNDDVNEWSKDELYAAAHEVAAEDIAEEVRHRADRVLQDLVKWQQEQKMSPADRHYLNVYPVFIRAVVEQMVERQREMEMDLEPEERVPFVNFMDTIGRAHFEYLVEEMVEDAVKLAEDYT
jgi:hypothetical protein